MNPSSTSALTCWSPTLADGGARPWITSPTWPTSRLSPSTEKLDRATKLPIYAREGVGHVWLVNPLTRTLEVLRLEHALALALALALGLLWADVRL